MEAVAIVTGLTGAICAAGGVVGLRLGWRAPDQHRQHILASGWIFVILGAVALAWTLGPVPGTMIALCVFSLSGYGAVACNAERRPRRERSDRAPAAASPTVRWGHAWGRGLTTSLLAMISALALGSAIAGLPLGPAVDRVTLGGVALPLVWAALMIWALSDPRLRRPVLGLTAVLFLSGLVIAAELLS